MLLDQLASYALDAVGALVILLVGWWIAGRAQYLVRRGLDRVPRIDDTLKPFLSSSVRYFVIVITFVAVLAEFGVQTTSIIAVLGAAGLASALLFRARCRTLRPVSCCWFSGPSALESTSMLAVCPVP